MKKKYKNKYVKPNIDFIGKSKMFVIPIEDYIINIEHFIKRNCIESNLKR